MSIENGCEYYFDCETCANTTCIVVKQRVKLELLSSKYNLVHDKITTLNSEKLELQKQVDELNKELEKAYETERANIQAEIAEAGTSCHWCKLQVVKDTAKEIFTRLAKRRNQGIDGGGFFVEYTLRLEDLNWFEEKYGVEVE